MAEPISFGALVGLMVSGTAAPDSARGVVRSVEEGVETRRRIARRGHLARVEDLDGTVRTVAGQAAQWFRDGPTGAMITRPHDRHADVASPIGGLDVGGHRPSWSRWDGTDFTRPTGPVVETEFLGRPAYAVELAPPSHKPSPIQLVVDAQTGLVLRSANRDFGWEREWESVEIGVELPDELFSWDGPARDAAELRAERDAGHEADMARRRAWLTAHGLADLPFAVEPEVMLHEWDDGSGAFHASLDLHVGASLLRRPHSERPWPDADTLRWEYAHRWSDERWDWVLATDATISDEQLAVLKVRLASTT